TGFSLGSTVQSHTKGIWMWCVPHPKKPEHTLVLLDTEGLGDVEKAEEILQKHLKSMEPVIDTILQTDQTLTEKEKDIEVERVKAESAQAAAKRLEEMQIKNQQMLEQKEKSYQEHVKQLTEKMEKDRAQMLEEQERTLAFKLQEQARLLQEGFQNESKRLHNEIQSLQRRMDKPKKTCVIS
ncbi:Interferon-induced guanylate-binding protein 1, partial [Tupaia chinensis]